MRHYTRMHVFGRTGTIILVVGDVVVFILALVATLAIRYGAVPTETLVETHLGPFLALFIIWVLVFLSTGLYDRRFMLDRKRIPAVVVRAQVLNILISGVIFFVLPLGIQPKTNLLIYLVLSACMITVWRLYLFPRIPIGKETRVLVAGESDEARAIVRVLRENPHFKHVSVEQIPTDSDEARNQLVAYCRQAVPAGGLMVIADMRDAHTSALAHEIQVRTASGERIDFLSLPAVYEQLHHRIPPSLIADAWFIEHIGARPMRYAYIAQKRILDIAGALLLLPFIAVLMPCIALAIMLEDRTHSVWYVSTRIGQWGKPFRLIKFRTMNGCDAGSAALKSTLSVTRVGAFLRASRLDELPQVWNVLRGDLSFIGPRPEMPELAAVYAKEVPHYELRHVIKPGLSGWAQINDADAPRGGVDIERTVQKLSFDLYYLKHRSLLLDIEIALKTCNTLLLRTGS